MAPQKRPRVTVIVAGLAAAVALAAGVGALRARGIDPQTLLGAIGARGGRAAVQIGAVTNHAGVGGDALRAAAEAGLRDALGANDAADTSARGARVLRRGHVLDANVVRVERGAGRVRAEASVVVSTLPGRSYEFASTSAITLTGARADTDEAMADATRRAMRSAAEHAITQLAGR
ncbi:MAG: hypothetical protein U0325_04285 [Polyangiales bacterium]